MENASKALIISGSILIALLLITIGIQVLKPSSEMSETTISKSESMAISSFNSHFMSYFGDSVSGAETREFVSDVIRNNTDSKNSAILLNLYDIDGSRISTHKYTPSSLKNTILNNISISYKYKIYVTTGCTESGTKGGYRNGYLRCISIKIVDK